MEDWNPWISIIFGPLVVTIIGTIAAEMILKRIPSAPAAPTSTTGNQQIAFNAGTGSLTQTIAPVYNTHNYYGRAIESSKRVTSSSNNDQFVYFLVATVALLVALVAFALVFLRFLDWILFGISSLTMLMITTTVALATASRRVWTNFSAQGAGVMLSTLMTAGGAMIFWIIGSGPVGTTDQTVWDLHTMVSARNDEWFSWEPVDLALGQAGKAALLFIVLGLLYLALAITFVCTQLFCWVGALKSPSIPGVNPSIGVARRAMQFDQFGFFHPLFVAILVGLSIFFVNIRPAEVLVPGSSPASTPTSPTFVETTNPSGPTPTTG